MDERNFHQKQFDLNHNSSRKNLNLNRQTYRHTNNSNYRVDSRLKCLIDYLPGSIRGLYTGVREWLLYNTPFHFSFIKYLWPCVYTDSQNDL